MDHPPMLPPAAQEIVDAEHLRLLGIFHYVLGGLTILFGSLFLVHVFMGLTLAANPGFFPDPASASRSLPPVQGSLAPDVPPAIPSSASPSPVPHLSPYARPTPPAFEGPPPFFGYLIAGLGAFAVLAGWTVGALNIFSGWSMGRLRHRTFSLVLAALNCVFFPFGTVLGVFTFVVLLRPAVAWRYAAGSAGWGGAPPLPGRVA